MATDHTSETSSVGVCPLCEKPIIDEHPDEVRMFDGKQVHTDCYFQKLGEVIENHPITSPRRHG
jgi:hypothetical protein